MTLPVVAIVGLSDSGKTTVASAIIKSLKARGYSIAAVKHSPHGHRLDWPGSDSSRLLAAGADRMILSSPGRLSTIELTDGDAKIEDIVALLDSSYDLVIAEGFKDSAVPKVLVTGEEELLPSPQNIMAAVGTHKATSDVPSYSFEELDGLAQQIQEHMLSRAPDNPAISLVIDGVPVSLGSFASSALSQVILGYLNALKDIPPNPQRVRITLGCGTATNGQREVFYDI